MRQTRVLLVEDEEIILADLSRTLRKHGYEIAATALSGHEAIRAAAAFHPDVVLMDVRLQGGMDGVEAARRIRLTSEVPIVFVSANADLLHLAKMPGRHSAVGKPFSLSQLREAMNSVLALDAS